jgi:hypothetical protein
MGLFKKTPKPARDNPAEREMNAGAREYVARIHDRSAERLASAGDAEGAAAERAAAAEARRAPARPSPRRSA